MKKKILGVLLVVCAIFTITGCGSNKNESKVLRGVYNSLTKAGSNYSETKKYDTTSKYSEKINGDKITITVKGDYINGSWDYVLDGDYITYKNSGEDYSGLIYFTYIISAVGDYLGMDPDLFGAYIQGLGTLNIQNDYYSYVEDGDTETFKIYVGGKYDMKELDSMYITEDSLFFDELDDNYTSQYVAMGKLRMHTTGSKDSLDIIIAEYGEIDDLAYKSIINIVKALKPTNYEKFINSYTELGEKKTDEYEVSYLTDKEEIEEKFTEYNTKFKFMKIHFGE